MLHDIKKGKSVRHKYTDEELSLLAVKTKPTTKRITPSTSTPLWGLRDAFINTYAKEEFDYSATVVFNEPRSIDFVRNRLREWHKRLDRKLVGPNHTNKPNNQRLFFVGCIEHPNTNIHVHMMVKLPSLDKAHTFELYAPFLWDKVTVTGDLVCQPITSDIGKLKAIKYMAKDMWQEAAFENFIISTEFSSK